MYDLYPNCESLNMDIKIWRYMDFAKFLSILDKQALFFTRVDKLEDLYEGSLTKEDVGISKQLRNECDECGKKYLLDEKDAIEKSKNQRHLFFTNCWHMNEYESAAMWKLYGKDDKSIAIQSNFGRILKSLENTSETVIVGKVNYIDHEKECFSSHYEYEKLVKYLNYILFVRYLCKGKSFQYESELRLIVFYPHEPNKEEFKPVCIPDIGYYVNIGIKQLIENIYISPTADSWFYELVKSVIAKYGYNFNVEPFDLNKRPLF